MSLKISEGGEYEKLETGLYQGTCYQIVDMGTTEQEYEGQKSKKKRIQLTFEISKSLDIDGNEQPEAQARSTKMNDGRPFAVSALYTASLFESAALRKHLVSWRGRQFTEEELAGFDIDKLLGCTANVEVGLTKGGNPKIVGLYKPDGGVQVVPTVNEIRAFDLDEYSKEWTGEMCDTSKKMCDIYDSLPMWIQNDIDDSFELRAAKAKGEAAGFTRDGDESSSVDELSALTDEAAKNNSPDFGEDDEGLTEDKIPF